MAKISMLHTSYVHIYFDNVNKIIVAKWFGYLKPEEVREGCTFMTHFISNNNVKNHLSDHRDLQVLSQKVQDYLTREWFPEVESAGLEKVAALVSNDVFAEVAVSFVNREAKVGKLAIDMFNTEEECLSWLLSQEQR